MAMGGNLWLSIKINYDIAIRSACMKRIFLTCKTMIAMQLLG